jgi:hypothetical protein
MVMVIAILSITPFVEAQQSASQDPLMSLMLATPPIDVDSPVVPATSFEPPVVRPGQWATYRATFNALEESVEWPEKLTAPPGLELRAGAHGQMLGMGPRLQPHSCFNYHVQASQPGRYTIPEFKIKVYDKEVTVPTAELEVADSPPPQPPAQQLTLEFPETNLFVGQPVRVVVRFPVGPNGQLLIPHQQPPVQINGQGFIFDNSSLRQRPDLQPRGPALVFEGTLVPLAVGRLSAVAQSFVGNRFAGPIVISGSGPVTIPGGPPQFTLLESDAVSVQVRPLPREGQLPGFTGAVGSLEVDPPVLSTNMLRLGDMAKLTVRVRGDASGSLAHLVPPPPPRMADWQVSPAQPEGLPPQLMHAPNYAIFSYILIPLSLAPHNTPSIPFSCFDPNHGAYVDLTIPGVPVLIKPGAAPAEVRALAEAQAKVPQEEKEPTLSGLAAAPGLTASTLVPVQWQAWFPAVQLAPIITFFGLWGWDRRRRYLAQHPDIVLRRRARHALRRERRALRRAARAADAPRFAACAVRSLRFACAPHYPAEPRALVGADILAVLPETERAGRAGETVRRVFAVSDAAQFGPASSDSAELLQFEPALEAVLGQLEERL